MRSNKAEEEVAELMKKSTQLEVELDKTKEQLVMMMLRRILMMIVVMMKSSQLKIKLDTILSSNVHLTNLTCPTVKFLIRDEFESLPGDDHSEAG